MVALTDARQRSHAALMHSLQINQHMSDGGYNTVGALVASGSSLGAHLNAPQQCVRTKPTPCERQHHSDGILATGVTVLPVYTQQAVQLNTSAMSSASHKGTLLNKPPTLSNEDSRGAVKRPTWSSSLGVLKPKKWLHKGLLDTLWHRRRQAGGSDDADMARRGAAVLGMTGQPETKSMMDGAHNTTRGAAHNTTSSPQRTTYTNNATDKRLLHAARRQLGWQTRVASEASFTVLDLAVGARRRLHRRVLEAPHRESNAATNKQPDAEAQHQVSSSAPPEAVLASLRPTVVRVGAHGWEPRLLDSMLQAWAAENASAEALPSAVLAAWDVDRMHAAGMDPGCLLQRLVALGYSHIVQAVTACCLPSNHTTVLAAAIAMHAGCAMMDRHPRPTALTTSICIQSRRPVGSRKASVNWCDVPGTSVQALLAPPTFGHPLRYEALADTDLHHHAFGHPSPGTWCLCINTARWQRRAPTHTTSPFVRARQGVIHWYQTPGRATTEHNTWRAVPHGIRW